MTWLSQSLIPKKGRSPFAGEVLMVLKGYQLSLISDIEPYWIENPHPPEQPDRPAQNRPQRHRYPGKGKASGWIEQRKTNRQRQKASVYWVYRWQDQDGNHSRYIPMALLDDVRSRIDRGDTIAEIKRFLNRDCQYCCHLLR